MTGISLLFFISFLFVGDKISRLIFANRIADFRCKFIKYIFATFATIFTALPIFRVLWDYYSLINLFYSLFGGISVFCALLILRFVAECIMQDFGTNFLQRFKMQAQNPRVFVVIFAFSAVLFLGHLDLISVDIFSADKAICAIFVALFIVALYLADKITGILGLFAFIIALILEQVSTQGALFALFDGYLLIYSFAVSIIWGFRKILG